MEARNPITRRHMIQMTALAGGTAMLRARPALAQGAPHIDTFDPALDAIISTSEPIKVLAEGYGGPNGQAEGPVWWSDGGYLLFSDINGNRRITYTPGQG
jgi:hypothetical protein